MPRLDNESEKKIPLAVDLDGTLLNTDTLRESISDVVSHNPFYLVMMPIWLIRGRAFFKEKMANLVDLNIESLPYNQEFLNFLRKERNQGRSLVLATAAAAAIAERVAAHLGIFDEVFATSNGKNLKGKVKLEALMTRYGPKGFDYAGNESADLKIWAQARFAIIVSSSPILIRKARKVSTVLCVFSNQ